MTETFRAQADALLPSTTTTIEHDGENRATAALDAFGDGTDQADYDYTDPLELHEIGADLICDLLHLAATVGIDPDDLLDRARRYYEHEQTEQAST